MMVFMIDLIYQIEIQNFDAIQGDKYNEDDLYRINNIEQTRLCVLDIPPLPADCYYQTEGSYEG